MNQEIGKMSDALKNVLKDEKNYHSELEHGNKVLEECLRKYDFASLSAAIDYFELPATMNFEHVPADKPLEILMVAEKPSMGREVARVLSNNTYKSSGEGKETVYSLTCELFGRRANVWIAATYGHLSKQSFKTELKEDQSETAFFAKIVNAPCGGSVGRHFFAKLAEEADAVILWLDNDHEGEAISFEVIEYLINYIKVPPNNRRMDAFFRARFSSPSEAAAARAANWSKHQGGGTFPSSTPLFAALAAAITTLDRPNFRRYLAMVAKHYIDLRVGVPFSRYQKFAVKDLLDTYMWKLSFGSCSTVAVAIIVDHYLQTKNSPMKFCLEYNIDVDGHELLIQSEPLAENTAKECCAALQKFTVCQVLEGPKRVKSVVVSAPPGLNTFELMRVQSAYYGRSAAVTASIAQDLYEMGMITYPRSESTKYPRDLNCYPKQLYENLCRLMKSDKIGFSPFMRLDSQKAMQNGIDKGDHPPIMPTGKRFTARDANRLSDAHIEVYHFICRRLLASFMPDYQYSNESLTFDMGYHELPFEYFQNQSLDFTQILPEQKAATPDDRLCAKLLPGAKFKFSVSVKECPPRAMYEHELIQKMEEYNIGTDGSIPNHIDFIEREGFVKINPETREMIPEDLGIAMIAGYQMCIPEMITPEFRADFIQDIEDIANGKKDFVTVYNGKMREYYAFYQKFEECFPKYVNDNKDDLAPLIRKKNNEDMEKAAAEVAALKLAESKLQVVP